MQSFEIPILRLLNQQVIKSTANSPEDVVKNLGAMQAQDYNMMKWAIGVRCKETTDTIVEAALNEGKLIRTHLMRPTWHVVKAEDAGWLIELTAPNILSAMKSFDKKLELTASVLKKSKAVIEKALQAGQHLTRGELITELEKAKINTANNRASHLFMYAELDRLICSGKMNGKKQTFALFDERVPHPTRISKEEALATLARKYFTAHGPATIPDFVWWSGLRMKDAKHALELVKSDLDAEKIGEQTYWLNPASPLTRGKQTGVFLLPAFDEFLISYRDRSAAIIFENHKKAVSNNGIFRPIIVHNGQVIGIWKRTVKKKTVHIETEFFEKPVQLIHDLVEEKAKAFGGFLGKEVVF